MPKRSLDDIRALIDPEGYIEAMKQGQQSLIERRSLLFVDYDMAADTPELSADERKAALTKLEQLIRDCQWRIDEIARRIGAAKDGAMNRAERRRAKR
ncbi:MAG TPA: hypothetical protein VJP78_09595 [Thermoleophilia bacterium]|nr:hypothetical protein [Thermoleophilia bacterium]